MNPLKMWEKGIGKWSPSSRKTPYKANMGDFCRDYDELSTYSQLSTKKEKEAKRKKGLLRPFNHDFFIDLLRSLI